MSDIGASDVPYSPTIVSQDKDKPFYPTFSEWVMLKGTKIVSGLFGEATGTLYTIPAGHTFFLQHVSLSSRNTGAGTTTHRIDITNPTDSGNIVSINLGATSSGVSNQTFNPFLPIEGGKGISLAGDNVSICQIIGYLIKKDSIPIV